MKKMLTMAAVLSASLLFLCACSSTDPPADPGEAPLQSWYKTDAYTLLLPQGFTAQEGEDGGVTLSLDGQAVGGVQVVPYPDAAGFLDTVGAASEDSRDSGKELMRQLSPEERLAYMMTVSEDGTYLEISPRRRRPCTTSSPRGTSSMTSTSSPARFQRTSNRFWWTASPCTHNQPPKERCGIPDSAPLPCLQGVPMVHCLSRKLSCPKRRRKNSLSGQGEWMSPGRDGLDGPLLAGQALWDILGLPACPVPGAAP